MALFGTKTEDTEKKVETVSAASSKPVNLVANVLVQPRISEKASKLSAQNKYVFKVLKSANKVEVAKAVQKTYKVKVLQVNIVNNKGKNRVFGRTAGRTSDFKKAIVTLKEGDKIEIAE